MGEESPQGGNAENSVAISDGRKRQLAALRRHAWRKGVSGNPGGRPKGIFGKAALRQLLKRAKNGGRNIDAIVSTQVEMAKAPGKLSTRAAAFLRDTTDGPPVRDREGVDIGTVNILWNCPMPEWAPAGMRTASDPDVPIPVTPEPKTPAQ